MTAVERHIAEIARLDGENYRLRAALMYLRKNVDGFSTTFDIAEQIARGEVDPSGTIYTKDHTGG